MRSLATLATWVGLFMFVSTPIQAAIILDQNNPTIHNVENAFCSIETSVFCAQSFQQDHTNIAGAGVSLRAFGFVADAPVTISIFSSYGNGLPPTGLIATGTILTESPGFVDVFWDPAIVALETTYFLVIGSPFETLSLQESGFDLYPFGHAHLNGSLGGNSTADLAFRTFYEEVPEPTTLALFTFGLAGMGFMMRRRRRSQAQGPAALVCHSGLERG